MIDVGESVVNNAFGIDPDITASDLIAYAEDEIAALRDLAGSGLGQRRGR